MKRLLLLIMMLPTLAFAALTKEPVSYATSGEPLFAAARTIEKSLGTRVILQGLQDDQTISGKYHGANGKAFLDDFASKNGFTWGEVNGQVVLAPAGTDLSPILSPRAKVVSTSSFSKVLYDPKDKDKLGLMIFQVHNAWADNKTLGAATVPGVSQLFSQYVGIPISRPMTTNQTPAANTPTRVEREAAATPKVQTGSFASLFTRNVPQAPQAPTAEESNPANVTFGVRGVYADPRLNAVLVRDKVAFFETYKQIIALLDKPTDMVQMDALIVDIRKDKALQYGVNWNWGQSAAGGLGGNIVFGAGHAANQLLANIRLSQINGDSETLSVPSIVTLNNAEAVFSNTFNKYIGVSGSYDASLNKVTAETSLRITPLIANESHQVAYNERRVKLLVNVQDGSFDESNTGNKNGPSTHTTNQNQITTQAVVRSGDMLVIGGNVVRRKVSESSGVPGLSAIPLIGGLFGTQGSQFAEYVRVYIIRTNILGEDSQSAREVTMPLSEQVRTLIN